MPTLRRVMSSDALIEREVQSLPPLKSLNMETDSAVQAQN
jgi:hypothetical protein